MPDKQTMITPDNALPGRTTPMPVTETHFVNHTDLTIAPTADEDVILLGMGCFWGAERLFWQLEGVVSTSVGYSGGFTPNPTYEEVCTGQTGHAEVVRVVFNTKKISLEGLLQHFWERHDPTQGMRQGEDLGTQYRSVIFTYNEDQHKRCQLSKETYQQALGNAPDDKITTDILPAGNFYYAETYHQQYLARNPEGYCGLGGKGVCFPPSLAQ